MAARYFPNRLDQAAGEAAAALDAGALRASLRSTLEYVLGGREQLQEPCVYTGEVGSAGALFPRLGCLSD
jgi:hypothetical protein